ncbi:PilT/PilU family type 4a pilus ATPase [Myxococcus sp. XM-1-1-1]|uniref:type IV pilus twitching motility protein PilT n=1 Tax=Myxococcus sp. XM-1-1-1 TaxID=2874602 RepID=UPI001CC0BA30|nr:PilT/PilU family type 4a pilus ATPase [Myxococcus sp. XM-1-1-1]MBZ4413008.1 PilT/PilU family type 4a pilus ATPase [Myxococcus sp. XM-1-1-1]
MRPLAELLRHLSRPGVTELTLATGRPPMIRGSSGYEPVDPAAVTTEDVVRALQAMVGVARASTVSDSPSQWSVNANGLGALSIAAQRRGDLMHLRLSRAAEAGATAAAPAASTAAASATARAPAAAVQGATGYGGQAAASAGASAQGAGQGAAGYGGQAASAGYAAQGAGQATSAAAGYSAQSAVRNVATGGHGAQAASPGAAAGYGAQGTTGQATSPGASAGYGAQPASAGYGAHDAGQASSPGASAGYGAQGAAAQNTATGYAPSQGGYSSAGTQEAARTLAASRLTGGARDLAVVLEQGRSVRASDVHVVAERPVLFRLAGDLVPQGGVLDAARVEGMLLPVVPERLRAVLERDGSCDFSLDSPEMGRFRVNVSRHRTGLKGTFRVIARDIPTLESLGLPQDIAKATHHHQGLIVITGPSGHGKTSTLAALVDLINSHTSHHILTVEDPVEFVHPRKKALISQREVGAHTRTFASALKGSLREDPDVIVVGELRDTETVRMALAAAETGHLLISTMNTPSAAKTIDRLIDLFPPADQQQVRLSLSSGLRLIVSQRLMASADGKSMVAAAEVLPGSVALGNLIRDNKTYQIPSLQQRGKSLGIVRFEDSMADLVRAGKVKLEVAKGFVDNPDELEAVVTGRRPGTAVAAPETPQDSARLLSKMGSLMGRKGG